MQGGGDFGYREVGELRQMLNFMKRTVTGQGLENEGEETGDRVAGQGAAKEKETCEGLITMIFFFHISS